MKAILLLAALLLGGKAKAASFISSCTPDQISIVCPQTITAASTVTWSAPQTFLKSATVNNPNVGGFYDQTMPAPAGNLVADSSGTITRLTTLEGMEQSGGGVISQFGYGGIGGSFIGVCNDGTEAAPTACPVDALITFIGAKPYDGTTGSASIGSKGAFSIRTSEATTPTATGTRATIETAKIGTTARRQRVIVYDTGNVQIAPRANIVTPGAALDVTGVDAGIGESGNGISINAREAIVAVGSVTASAFVGSGSLLTALTAANISAGTLGASVVASSVAVQKVLDSAIVSVAGSKVTGNITGNAGGAPPTGSAGGNLGGTYPNPTLASLPALSANNLTDYSVNASSTSTNAVNINSLVFIQVTTQAVTLRGSRPLLGLATFLLSNAAGGSRSYTAEIERGGTAVSNTYSTFITAGDTQTMTIHWFETSSSAGSQSYTISIKSSSVTGTQTATSRRLTMLEL